MPDDAIARALLDHFDRHRRDLPWRDTADPYAIWVSEVMLQQTRVETVVPYYERWLDRFPTVDALARADLDDVLRAWQGLGYYSRARNLHRAAGVVRERHGGRLPESVEALRTLPGVGEYTAGAVASIAHGVVAPAVDGNVRRVLARLHDLPRPTAARLRDLARRLVPADRPGDFNQALMELGATVCTPRSPDCGACPVARWCRARAAGVQEERPLPPRRKAVPEETVDTAVLVRPGGAMLLARRPEDGLLAGMWEFPGDDAPAPLARLIEDADPLQALDAVPHVFSHKKITYLPTLYRAPAEPRQRTPPTRPGAGGSPAGWAGRELAWVAPEAMDRYALPVAQQKIARLARSAWAGREREPEGSGAG